MATNVSYTIILEPAEEGGFNVTVPALPGCFTQGATQEEAIEMAEDAISLWLQVLKKKGEAIPVELTSSKFELVRVQVPVPSETRADCRH